jgi:SH3-like domain-containing protein
MSIGQLFRIGAVLAIVAGTGIAVTYWGGESSAVIAQAQSAKAVPSPAGGALALGPVSGLPIPRFVSLKSDKVNVRRGPANDQDVAWVFSRAGLPVEITAEWDNWRRIRDQDGAEGWVFHSLLSGRRTALIEPWSKEATLPLRRNGSSDATVVAMLQPKVLASVSACDGSWCRIWGDGFDGWMQQDKLWGIYPGEQFD